MSYWGKLIGGVAGFAVAGPWGALFGASLGHAVDTGSLQAGRALPFDTARLAAMLGRREQVFAISVTTLAAKLAKCDGAVSRAEIDAFRASFRIPDQNIREIGMLFDHARDSPDGYESHARQLGLAFADHRSILEQVLAGLYNIARADGPVNAAESIFLGRVAYEFGLDNAAANRANFGGAENNPYEVLGINRAASNDEVRTRWKSLVREHHPDSLASKGVPPEMIKAATERIAKINAAYDVIKRERKL